MSATAGTPAPARLFEMLDRPSPDAPLLICDDGTITYGQLRDRAARFAAGLRAHGVERGDRLALALPNCAEWVVAAMACSRLGVAVLSLNVRLGGKELSDLISRTTAKALIYPPAHRNGAFVQTLRSADPVKLASLRLIIAAGEGSANFSLPHAEHFDFAELEQAKEDAPCNGEGCDPCLILATSGTTSAPKLVVHVQERVSAHVRDAAGSLGFGPNSSLFIGIPVCGAFGYTLLMTAISDGRPIVMVDNFDPAEAVRLIDEHRVTHALGTNDMLKKMLDAAPADPPLPTLFMYGHANFTPGLTDLPAEAERRGVRIRGFYGMTETLALFAAQPLDGALELRAEGGGHPVCPAARFRIRDLDSDALLESGEIGMIEVSTPNVMAGYLNDAEKTAEAFTEDGFLRTGDLGYAHPGGGFVFVSRQNDVLRIGGYLVNPAEIEDVIRSQDGVKVCQVVAVARPEGARPVAFVETHPEAAFDEQALIAACRASLAVYKCPVRIFRVDKMPVTEGPNGAKVKKHVLRDVAVQFMEEASRT